MSEQLVVTARRVRNAYLTMLISASLSLFAAMVLSIDAFKLAKDENVDLSCSINAVVSCGKVALSWQSTVFGFPNSFIGLMFESAVITIAIAGLMQVRFPNSLIRNAFFIYSAALIFALWLFSQSFFVINALCPWCLLVTGSTITVFATITRVVLLENTWNLAPERQVKIVAFLDKGWGRVIYTGAFATITIAIIVKYGNKLFS
jgi:uncharacterized membrane protein